jgi:hypothetical protein
MRTQFLATIKRKPHGSQNRSSVQSINKEETRSKKDSLENDIRMSPKAYNVTFLDIQQ